MTFEDFKEAVRQYNAEQERKKLWTEERKRLKDGFPLPAKAAQHPTPRPPIHRPEPTPDEDYTGSVCLLHKLTPKTPCYEEVLVDAEDFERVKHLSWRIDRWGRNKEKYAVSKKCVQI